MEPDNDSSDLVSIIDSAMQSSLTDPDLRAAAQGVINLTDLEKLVPVRPEFAEILVSEELISWRNSRQELHETEIRLRGAIRNSLENPTTFSGSVRKLFQTPEMITAKTEARLKDQQDYRRASRILAGRRSTLLRSIVERYTLPSLRTALNNVLDQDPSNTVLRRSESRGLSQLLPPGFELTSRTRDRLESLLSSLSTASIGIAGPRGSGKTTLLSWYSSEHQRTSDLRVMISAPVSYESRDYLLFILTTLCRSYLHIVGEPSRATPKRERPGDEWLRPYIVRHLSYGAAIVAATALVFWGCISTARNLGRPDYQYLVDPALGLILALLLYSAATGLREVSIKPIADVQLMRKPEIAATALYAVGSLQIVRVLAVIGTVTLALLWYRGSSPPVIVVAGAIGILLGSMALLTLLNGSRASGWDNREQELTLIRDRYGRGSEQGWSYADEVRELLIRASHQRAISSSQADKVGISASFGVTASADTTKTSGESLTTVPWTTPEIVQEIRLLLTSITTTSPPRKRRRVVLSIDELDKVESSVHAVSFIDDLKGIFGIPGCYYLISISDDALAEFERRGMPFRTAFDSAFDDVLTLGYFDLVESTRLMRSRIIAVPVLFICLCHALSGGLPRDLLRVARRLYDLPLPVSLAHAALQLIEEETRKRVSVLSDSLRHQPVRSSIDPVIQWIENFAELELTAKSLLIAAGELQKLATSYETRGARLPKDDLVRLCDETATFLYYGATILEVSGETGEEADRIRMMDRLSSARQAFAVHPALAWARVSACRLEEDWTTIDRTSA